MKFRLLLASVLMTVSVYGQNVPSYVPTNGLVGWWPFNGNANDESGNGNNGTVNGAMLTTGRFGNINCAYEFNGAGSHITSSSINLGDSATISVWVNPYRDNAGGSSSFSASLVDHNIDASGNSSYALYYNNIIGSPSPWGVYCHVGWSGDTNNTVYSRQLISLNSWHHLVMTRSGGIVSVFMDGTLIYTKSAVNPTSQSSSLLYFGRAPWGGNFFEGKLDDIGIWNRALTQQEITSLYNASNPAPILSCSGAFLPQNLFNGLVGWWPFCGDADDESGNGNNGTVNGAALTSDRFGNVNSAFSFNGLNNSINIPPSSSLDNFNNSISISAWIYNQGASGSSSYGNQDLQGVFGPATYLVNDGGFFLRLYDTSYDSINDRSIQFAVGQPGGSIFSNAVINVNNWEHIVATYDGGTIRLFRNSHLADSILIGPGLTSSLNTSGRYYTIGQCIDWSSGSTLQAFNGILDDIGIWNRALDSSEVAQLYNTGLCTQTIAGSCDTLIFNANITGFNPVTYANQVKVYPNPAADNLVIDCGTNYAGLNGYSIRITNLLGQTVYNSPVTAQITNIQLTPPTWVNGTYVVQFVHPNGTVMETKRIIIQ